MVSRTDKRKVILSRDVVFQEDQMPFLKPQISQGQENEHTRIQVEPGGVRVESQAEADEPPSDLSPVQEEQQVEDLISDIQSTDLDNYLLTRDRARKTVRYNDSEYVLYALCIAENIEYAEPTNYKEAMASKEKDKWVRAMEEELESLMKNGIWILVDKMSSRKVVGCKWIFKKKVETGERNQIRLKARLVAKGFTQVEGVDFNEVFSQLVKQSSIRILLAVATQNNWELEQLDVKTAFLHGELDETIYMHQTKGFVQVGNEIKVYLLKRSLYGSRQSSRQWYKKFDESMADIGFMKSKYDSCVYVKHKNKRAVAYLLLYVDDMLISGPEKSEIEVVKEQLKACFEMKNLGPASRIMGMEIIRDRKKK